MSTGLMSMGEQEENNRKIIRLYFPLLEQTLIPAFIVPDLDKILGKDGIQTICEAEEESVELGAVKLLEVLMTSREPRWFQEFIHALKENGFDVVADNLADEAEVIDEELFTEFLSKSCKRLINEVNSLDLLPTLLENGTLTKRDATDIKTAADDEGSKSAMLLLLFRLPRQKNTWFYDFIRALRENESECYQTLASDIEAAVAEEGELVSLVENNLMISDFSTPSETIEEKTTEKKILNTAAAMDNSCESQSDNEAETSQIRTAANGRGAGDEEEKEIQAQPLVLRSYQKELAEPALNGKNVIIVAPTGSGKTHVALYITQNHFQESGGKKVIFFVPTTELVSQQTQMYHTYLSRYKVYGLSGEVQASQKVPISSLIDKYDILVMTPQTLLNALQKKDVLSLKVFTLMIFDECHHATKEHPYNNIMAAYLNEKYRENRDYYLPQIVGLTASVGVGKAHTPDKAKMHILSLCANLDTLDGISIVEKHKTELNKYVNKPKQETIEKHGRKEDPFRKIISKMMETIEDQMRRLLGNDTLEPLSEVPPGRGCDQYTQWISRIEKAVVTFHREDIRRSLYACQLYLQNYNTALIINDDCRTVDALTFLNKKIPDVDSSHKDETDRWLEKLFNEKRERLEEISQDPRYDNPKLKELAKVLLDKYNKNLDMRAIVFCKTREMTLALQKWIKETPQLAMLNPSRLAGSNVSEEKGGMTQHKQEDVLTYFNDGKHKVIIATSVGEEGIDVSKCNLVIRYEYVTNEIAMVQARGRGRAEDSDYIVLGDHNRGATQKEEMNKIRENMMNRAIEEVNKMSDGTRTQEIIRLQKQAMVEMEMNEAGRKKQASSSGPATSENWELRCVKCDNFGCLGADIRVVEGAHHVVLDETFRDRIILKINQKKTKIDDVTLGDKIFCKECRSDWGTCCIFKGVRLPVVKVRSFVVIDVVRESRNTYRKWKQVPFSVNSLSPDEMSKYSMNLMESDY